MAGAQGAAEAPTGTSQLRGALRALGWVGTAPQPPGMGAGTARCPAAAWLVGEHRERKTDGFHLSVLWRRSTRVGDFHLTRISIYDLHLELI